MWASSGPSAVVTRKPGTRLFQVLDRSRQGIGPCVPFFAPALRFARCEGCSDALSARSAVVFTHVPCERDSRRGRRAPYDPHSGFGSAMAAYVSPVASHLLDEVVSITVRIMRRWIFAVAFAAGSWWFPRSDRNGYRWSQPARRCWWPWSDRGMPTSAVARCRSNNRIDSLCANIVRGRTVQSAVHVAGLKTSRARCERQAIVNGGYAQGAWKLFTQNSHSIPRMCIVAYSCK